MEENSLLFVTLHNYEMERFVLFNTNIFIGLTCKKI